MAGSSISHSVRNVRQIVSYSVIGSIALLCPVSFVSGKMKHCYLGCWEKGCTDETDRNGWIELCRDNKVDELTPRGIEIWMGIIIGMGGYMNK